MGGMSILHWLLLLGIPALIILIVRTMSRPNWLTRRMMRLAERQYVRAPTRDVETITARPLESPVKPLDIAVVAAFCLTIFVLLFVVARNRTEPSWNQALDLTRMILHFLVPVGVIAALYLHYTPLINRVLKYRVLLAFAYLGPTLTPVRLLEQQIFWDFGRPQSLFGAPHFEPVSPVANNMVLWGAYLAWCALPFAVALISARHYRRAYFDAALSRQIAMTTLPARYRRATSLGATLLMYFTLTIALAPFFLLRRFFVAERMAREPIVFLRSFQHRKSAFLFGRVIAKVAARHGVAVGIAHATQTIGDLSTETSMVQQARLTSVSDRQWQDWVRAQLASAKAVIIERSIETKGVQWEIETALATVAPSRVALLNEKGVPRIEVPGVFQLEYELTTGGEQQARSALDQWLTGIDAGEQGAPQALSA